MTARQHVNGERVALIAMADERERTLLAENFDRAQFTVVSVSDRAGAVAAAKRIPADVAVVDIDIAQGYWAAVQTELQAHIPPISIPLILTLSRTEQLYADRDLELNAVDYVLKPLNTEDLIHRAVRAIEWDEQRNAKRRRTATLRERTRLVSAAIRGTNDPQVMARQLVDGLGQAFDADRVLLRTFEDERVPQIFAQWARPGLKAVPSSFGGDGATARAVAAGLWEESAIRTLGSGENKMGSSCPDLLQDADLLGAASAAVAPIGQGGTAFGILWLVSADTARSWTAVELSLTQHVLGNLAHGLIQGQLITGQQRVVEQLKELDQAKSDFVATVNHELRTPLTSIRGYLDMVQEGAGGEVPAAAAQMLKIVERNSLRLHNLMEDMLTISRIDAGRSAPLKRINVGTILHSVVTELSPLAFDYDVRLCLRLAEPKLMVDGDADQLEQAFSNVASNALKFSKPGGQVHIDAANARTDAGDPAITITVRDRGMGIPLQDVPQLFTRFYRASNATHAAVPGTGLGLAIVQEVINRHDGTLTVDSVEDQGTTMTIQLPGVRRQSRIRKVGPKR